MVDFSAVMYCGALKLGMMVNWYPIAVSDCVNNYPQKWAICALISISCRFLLFFFLFSCFTTFLGYVSPVRLSVHQCPTTCLIYETVVYQCATRFPMLAKVSLPSKNKVNANYIIRYNFFFQITLVMPKFIVSKWNHLCAFILWDLRYQNLFLYMRIYALVRVTEQKFIVCSYTVSVMSKFIFVGENLRAFVLWDS